MILAIAGKKQVGKDTVGKIIQTLIWLNAKPSNNMLDINALEMSIEEFVQTNLMFSPTGWRGFCNVGVESGWKIKKWASKVKEIVSILTGIPVEDMEKEEVKNN